METIAANLKYGVLVIQSYNSFKDGSDRPEYFIREFFHQDLRLEKPTTPLHPVADAPSLPYRMAGDLPTTRLPGEGAGRVDLTPLLGAWCNTYRSSTGIRRVVLSGEGGT